MPRLSSIVVVFALLALSACSTDDRQTLSVHAVSDFVPGPEASRLVTDLFGGDIERADAPLLARSEVGLRYGMPLTRGLQAGRFEGLARGEYSVTVSLLAPNGDRVAMRRLRVTIAADTTATAHLTVECANVTCPGGGSPALSACLGGRCVEPGCSAERRDLCPPNVFCHDDSDCGEAGSECAVAVCAGGVCVRTPVESACDVGEFCGRAGECAPLVESPPPREEDPRCGAVCTLTGSPCVYGYFDCLDGEGGERVVMCRPFLRRPAGASCGNALVCDLDGRCLATLVDAGADGAIDANLPADASAPFDAGVDLSVDAAPPPADLGEDTSVDAAPVDTSTPDAGLADCDAHVIATTNAHLAAYAHCSTLRSLDVSGAVTHVDLPVLVSVDGDVRIHDAPGLLEVLLPNLSSYGALFQIRHNGGTGCSDSYDYGALTVDCNGPLERVDLSSIASVAWWLVIENNDALSEIRLSSLENAGSYFGVRNNDALVAVELPDLRTVGSSLRVENNAVLQILSVPGPATITLDYVVQGNPILCAIDTSGITSNGAFGIVVSRGSACPSCDDPAVVNSDADLLAYLDCTSIPNLWVSGSVTHLHLPNLEEIWGAGSLVVLNASGLRSISLPALRSYGAGISIVNNGSMDCGPADAMIACNPLLETLDLSALVSANDLRIHDNEALTTLDFAALSTTNHVTVSDNASLASLHFRALTSVHSLGVTNNGALHSLSIQGPGLAIAVTANIDVYDNPNLCSVTHSTIAPEEHFLFYPGDGC